MDLNRRHFIAAGFASAASFAAPAILKAGARLTITISQAQPHFSALLSELTDQFAAENPAMAVKFVVDGDNWDPLLNNTLRASVVGALPDATWQSLTYAGLLASRGIAQPLDPLFRDNVKGLEDIGLSQLLIDASTVKNSVLCCPFGTTVPVVYCNMDLLRRAGYSKPQPPGTWDEIHEIGAKVAGLGGSINGGYIEYGGSNAWMFQNLLASYGGRMMNEAQSAIAFDGPPGLRSLEILSALGDIATTDMTIDQARQAFNSGVTGLHIRSASGTTSIAKAAAGRFEVAIAQFPVPVSNGRLAGAGHGFFMFAKDPAKQKVVWEFMKFAAGFKGQMILARTTGYLPVNRSVFGDTTFRDEYLKVNPLHLPILGRLAITGDQFSFATNPAKITQMMSDEMREVVNHRSKPEQALSRMAAQTRALLG